MINSPSPFWIDCNVVVPTTMRLPATSTDVEVGCLQLAYMTPSRNSTSPAPSSYSHIIIKGGERSEPPYLPPGGGTPIWVPEVSQATKLGGPLGPGPHLALTWQSFGPISHKETAPKTRSSDFPAPAALKIWLPSAGAIETARYT